MTYPLAERQIERFDDHHLAAATGAFSRGIFKAAPAKAPMRMLANIPMAFLLLCLDQAARAGLAAPSFEERAVAAVIVAEAGGEHAARPMRSAAQIAVAEVIARRAKIRGLTRLQVIQERGQFSCLLHTSLERLMRQAQRHQGYGEALEIAQAASYPNLTHGATHFTRKTERPYWAIGLHPVVVIGNHAFYRLTR